MGTETPSYRGFRYPVEIISHGVWLYYRFPLSFREVQERHCCIERSAHPTCSTRSPRSHGRGLRMSGLLGFSRVPEGSCLPAWCMARTLFASMQQCRQT